MIQQTESTTKHMTDFLEDVARTGGKFKKLEAEGDVIHGHVIEIELRNRTTPEGEVVLGKKSGKPRQVYHVHLATDERDPDFDGDDGTRIFDANESAQYAIKDAFKASGLKDPRGAEFWIKCTKVTGAYEQNEVVAKFGDVDLSKVASSDPVTAAAPTAAEAVRAAPSADDIFAA